MTTPLELWLDVREALKQTPRPKHADLAEARGVGRSRISNLARLNDLHADVQHMLEQGVLSLKHGEWLLRLPAGQQVSMANQCLRGDWSVAMLRAAINAALGKRDDDDGSCHSDGDIAHLETQLSEQLGTRVLVDHRTDGSGWLRIRYTDSSTLDGVLERLGYIS